MERHGDPSREAAPNLNRSLEHSRLLNAAMRRLDARCHRHDRYRNFPEEPTMSKLDNVQDRTLELIGEIGQGIRKAVPGRAMQWVETGAALGAIRTGGKVATKLVRRNPVLAGAAIAGAGLLWLAARQRAKRAERDPIDGTATRIDPKPRKRKASPTRSARKREENAADNSRA